MKLPWLVVGALLVVGACGGDDDGPEGETAGTLPAQSDCAGEVDASPRASDLEYEPGAPAVTTLRADGIDGDPLVVQGYVLFPDCRAVDSAVLDVWQADADGNYGDAALRGVFTSDDYGRYQIETIVPGDGVLHVKAAEAVGGRIVTTRIDIPDAAGAVVRADLVIENG